MATGISSTKDGKIHFRTPALITKLLGKVSLVEWDCQRPTLKSTTVQGMDRRFRISCPGFQEMAVRIPYSHSNASFIPFLNYVRKTKGRTTDGDPSTFTSVTELQYDRLVKWSKGEFTKIDVTDYKHFDDIPVDKQPAALTEAALEATIGAPLFPGIELSWNAEKSEIYQLDKPFTIHEDVKPGDLTKYLSLPWQSDFYMCRSYW